MNLTVKEVDLFPILGRCPDSGIIPFADLSLPKHQFAGNEVAVLG